MAARYRLILTVCCLLATALTSLAEEYDSDRPKPRMTSDKRPLPDAAPRLPIGKLPIIGDRLGALPEEVCSKLWEVDSDLDLVNTIRRTLTENGVDLGGYNYVGDGVAGFTYTLMHVENGRVRRILLYRPTLSSDKAWGLLKKIASDSQEKPTIKDNEVRFRFGGTHFYAQPVGSWSTKTDAVYRRNIDGSTSKAAPAKKSTGPAGLELGIDSDDWTAANVCKDPVILRAIQDHRLLQGMRPVEAYLAMKGHRLYRQVIKGAPVWTWSDTTLEVAEDTTVSDAYGTTNIIRRKPQEHLINRVTFKDGRIATIDDETTLETPDLKG